MKTTQKAPAQIAAPALGSWGVADMVAAQMRTVFPAARGMTLEKSGQPWDQTSVTFMVGQQLVTVIVSVET